METNNSLKQSIESNHNPEKRSNRQAMFKLFKQVDSLGLTHDTTALEPIIQCFNDLRVETLLDEEDNTSIFIRDK